MGTITVTGGERWGMTRLVDELGGGDPENEILRDIISLVVCRVEELALEEANVQIWWNLSSAEVLAEAMEDDNISGGSLTLRPYDPQRPVGELDLAYMRDRALQEVLDSCYRNDGPFTAEIVDILATHINKRLQEG